MGKPSVTDLHAIRAMRVFSSSGWNLSKSRFCHIHVDRSRLDRSVELHANVFREDDVDNMRVNESEVM